MDKAFYHMQHDDAARKDLFQVMKAFSKVKDADGQMVGPAFKTMKSEFVAFLELKTCTSCPKAPPCRICSMW